MSEKKEGSLCFYMFGEDLTGLARSMWADDKQPVRALKLLRSAFPEMEEGDVVSILTGAKKLVGDSRDGGLELVEDDTQESRNGNSLAIESVFEYFSKQAEDTEDHLQLAIDHVKIYGSPKGLVAIPRRRVEDYERKDVSLEDIPHRQLASKEAYECAGSEPERRRIDDILEEMDKPVPPKPHSKIATEFGWLSPEGKFYPCQWMEHIWLAKALGFGERDLEEQGWIKIERGEAFRPGGLRHDLDPTQSQIDLIFDYYTKKEKELPPWLLSKDD